MSVCLSIYLWLYSIFVGPWPLFHFLKLVRILGRGGRGDGQPVARSLPTHRIDAQRHPCLKWH
jgi:hypothetical protein